MMEDPFFKFFKCEEQISLVILEAKKIIGLAIFEFCRDFNIQKITRKILFCHFLIL